MHSLCVRRLAFFFPVVKSSRTLSSFCLSHKGYVSLSRRLDAQKLFSHQCWGNWSPQLSLNLGAPSQGLRGHRDSNCRGWGRNLPTSQGCAGTHAASSYGLGKLFVLFAALQSLACFSPAHIFIWCQRPLRIDAEWPWAVTPTNWQG